MSNGRGLTATFDKGGCIFIPQITIMYYQITGGNCHAISKEREYAGIFSGCRQGFYQFSER
jgi:hypothetical protein